MRRQSLVEKMRELTKNVPSTSEMSIVPSPEGTDERWLPRSGVGFISAWQTALARISVLEEVLHKAHKEICYEPVHQEARGLNAKLKDAWHRIDWLEAKLREYGLDIPGSGG